MLGAGIPSDPDNCYRLLTKSALIEKYGNLPIVFSGGVMSNSIISKKLNDKYGAYFAKPEFSCDNAVGTAVLTAIMEK